MQTKEQKYNEPLLSVCLMVAQIISNNIIQIFEQHVILTKYVNDHNIINFYNFKFFFV